MRAGQWNFHKPAPTSFKHTQSLLSFLSLYPLIPHISTMGIPKFARFFAERYPAISQLIADNHIPEFDCLYVRIFPLRMMG